MHIFKVNCHYIQDNVLFETPRRIAESESTQTQKAFETDFWVDLASFKNPEDTASWHTSNAEQNVTAEANLTYLNGSRSYEPILRTCRALRSSVWWDLTQDLEVMTNITTKGSPYRSRPLAIVYNNFIWGTGLLTPGGGGLIKSTYCLTDDPNSAPTTHAEWFSATCNSDAPFWSLCGIHAYTHS